MRHLDRQSGRAMWSRAALIAPILASLMGLGCSDDGATTSSTSGAGGNTASSGTSSTTTSGTSSATSAVSTGASSSSAMLPESFAVSGVVTDGSVPVEGAFVLQAGTSSPVLTTGADGSFTVLIDTTVPGVPAVVATKLGYRTTGLEFLAVPEDPIELQLKFVKAPDNPGYSYGPPGTGDATIDNSTAVCGHCHTTITAQFQTSAHAKATRDPLVHDLYAGVSSAYPDAASCALAGGQYRPGKTPGTAADLTSKCYLGAGVLPDLNPGCDAGATSCDDPSQPVGTGPTAFGACADCHAAGLNGALGGRDLLEATGIAYDNGNHCDVCHHVSDIDLSKPPGTGGRLVIHRSNEKIGGELSPTVVQVMFGPLLDVPNEFMGGSYQPKFSSSELCAGCHSLAQNALIPGQNLDVSRWPQGLAVHSTYEEWAESKYAATGMQCQACHMPPDDTGLVSGLDVTNAGNASITFGYLRPPSQIRKHIFRGPLEGSPRFIDSAVGLFVSASVLGNELVVSASVQNFAAGHALPTGEPMRSLVLLVDSLSCNGLLPATSGTTVPDLGGSTARGVVGTDLTVNGASLAWTGVASTKVGDVVRVVRPSGVYDDYAGIGFFADPSLTPYDKGMEVAVPVDTATVVSVAAAGLDLDHALSALPGDVVFVGDDVGQPAVDGEPSRAVAGAPGNVFARILVDAAGKRAVPHHRAVDMVSDNRIAPSAIATSTHGFALPVGCASATVRATLLYRPVPTDLGRERGWAPQDWVIAEAQTVVSLP